MVQPSNEKEIEELYHKDEAILYSRFNEILSSIIERAPLDPWFVEYFSKDWDEDKLYDMFYDGLNESAIKLLTGNEPPSVLDVEDVGWSAENGDWGVYAKYLISLTEDHKDWLYIGSSTRSTSYYGLTGMRARRHEHIGALEGDRRGLLVDKIYRKYAGEFIYGFSTIWIAPIPPNGSTYEAFLEIRAITLLFESVFMMWFSTFTTEAQGTFRSTSPIFLNSCTWDISSTSYHGGNFDLSVGYVENAFRADIMLSGEELVKHREKLKAIEKARKRTSRTNEQRSAEYKRFLARLALDPARAAQEKKRKDRVNASQRLKRKEREDSKPELKIQRLATNREKGYNQNWRNKQSDFYKEWKKVRDNDSRRANKGLPKNYIWPGDEDGTYAFEKLNGKPPLENPECDGAIRKKRYSGRA